MKHQVYTAEQVRSARYLAYSIFVVLCAFWLCSQVSCAAPPCQSGCQPGATKCDTTGQIMLMCALDVKSQCATWGSIPCSKGCQVGADGNASCHTQSGPPPTCQHQCNVNESRCVGNATQACGVDGLGCRIWQPSQPCSKGYICQNGVCEDNCKQLCTTGDTRCSGGAVQSCVEDVASGCPLWGEPKTCAQGETCQTGSCQPSQNCSTCTEGATRCTEDGLQTCIKDAKGCTAWNQPQACPAGQTCQNNKCEGGTSCQDACQAGKTRCQGEKLQTCAKGSQGCLSWGEAKSCTAGQTCQGNTCQPDCSAGCKDGTKRCSGNEVQTCIPDGKGCTKWSKTETCAAGQICQSSKCVSQGPLASRSEQDVCSRWKKDYPAPNALNFTNSGGCDPGTISQGSIDDAIRRISLFRYIVGLPGTTEDKSLTTKTQACAILQAHNDGPGGGVNAHKPPSSWTCYNSTGAAASGASNLSWGVGKPADTIDQYISDAGVASLGHRLWIISPGFGKTGIGMATGPGRYRVASCLYTFAKTSAPAVDFVAYPPPGPMPIQAMGTRHKVLDWSFTSSKYKVSSLTEVTLTRKSDGDVQKIKPRKISGYGNPSGLSFRPRFPQAGETYTVQFGTIYSYTVSFFDCK